MSASQDCAEYSVRAYSMPRNYTLKVFEIAGKYRVSSLSFSTPVQCFLTHFMRFSQIGLLGLRTCVLKNKKKNEKTVRRRRVNHFGKSTLKFART